MTVRALVILSPCVRDTGPTGISAVVWLTEMTEWGHIERGDHWQGSGAKLS